MNRNSKDESVVSLAYVPAHRQLELFRQGHLSPVDVLQAQIDRVKAGSQSINAVTYPHFDEAFSAARASEVRYRDGKPRPLEGITVAVKEEYKRCRARSRDGHSGHRIRHGRINSGSGRSQWSLWLKTSLRPDRFA
jgi:Amidase